MEDKKYYLPADKIAFMKDAIDKLKVENKDDHKAGEFDRYNWEYQGRYRAFEDVLQWLNEGVPQGGVPLRETIENVLYITGKHNQDECSELADAIIRDAPRQPGAAWPLYVVDKTTGDRHEVNKIVYHPENDPEPHAWCDTWYGHHIIGKDCEWANEPTSGAVWVKASEFKYEVGTPYHAKDSKSKGAGSFDESGVFKWGDDSITLPHNQSGLLILNESGTAAGREEKGNKNEFVEILDNALDAGKKVLEELKKENVAKEREEDAVAFANFLDEQRNSVTPEMWTEKVVWSSPNAFQEWLKYFKQQKEK